MHSVEPYYVDFLREPPEPTGEENDDADLEAPKIYEAVSRRFVFTVYLEMVHSTLARLSPRGLARHCICCLHAASVSFSAHFCCLLLQIRNLDELSDKLKAYMTQYNETVRGANMDLVFFKDAMTHLVKVSTTFMECVLWFPALTQDCLNLTVHACRGRSENHSLDAAFDCSCLTMLGALGLATLFHSWSVHMLTHTHVILDPCKTNNALGLIFGFRTFSLVVFPGISHHPNSTRERATRWSGRIRKTKLDQVGIVHRRLRDLPNYINQVCAYHRWVDCFRQTMKI